MKPLEARRAKPLTKEIIAPKGFPTPPIPHSPAIRAGPWVFVSGQLASDFKTGLAPEARINENWPYCVSKIKRETAYIFENIKTLLETANTSLDNIVRIDQFFAPKALVMGSTPRSVTDFLEQRNIKWLHEPRPASTGLEITRLPVPDTNLAMDVIAIIPDHKMKKEGIRCDRVPTPLAGYSPAIRAGDYVFLAGDVASDWKRPIAPEASVDYGMWYGSDVKQQAEYALNKMKLVLEDSGSSLDSVVKAQVYLPDIRDLYGLDEVWRRYFPTNPPARTVVPINGLGGQGWRVEINMIAILKGGEVKKEIIETKKAPRSPMHESQAVKAGELLFLSGQMAADESGLAPEARIDPSFPYFGISTKRQMRYILNNMKAICEAAGTTLQNIVRTQIFHSDLNEFAAAMEEWATTFPKEPPTSTIVEVKGPMPVIGCSVLVDATAVAPEIDAS